MKRRLLAQSLPLTLCFLGTSLLAQTTYTVTSTADGPTAAATPGTLRNAVAQAEANAGGDIIEFDAAIAGDTITLTEGQLVINESLTIDATITGVEGPGIVISGGWDGVNDNDGNGIFVGSRILNLPDNDARTLVIRRVHLTRANAGDLDGGTNYGVDASNSNGGCLYANGGSVALEESMMSFSTANDGAFVELVKGSLTAVGCTFFSARARDDGAVFDLKRANNANASTQRTSITATNCTFYDNFTGFGGTAGSTNREGSVARNDADLTLEHCTVAYNFTEDGGVIDNRGILRLHNNLFVVNQSEEAGAESIENNVSDGGDGTVDPGEEAEVYGPTGTDPLDPSDGNYTEEAIADALVGFNNPPGADPAARIGSIKLGPLADNGGPTLTCALDCRSDLRGILTASEAGDQRGEPRSSGTNEPGAFEILNCPDTDGDTVIDFTDADDDADGISDATELSNAPLGTTDIATALGGATDPSGDTLSLNGTDVSFATSTGAGTLTVEALASGVQGGSGLRFVSDPVSPGETQIFSIAFADPVYGLGFSLADLDANAATGLDQVSITLFADDQAFAISEASASVSVGSNVDANGSRFSAIANSPQDPDSGTDGTVTISNLPFRVTRIELSFEAGLVSGDPSARDFFITDLTFRNPAAIDPDDDGRPAPLDIDADGDGIVDNNEAQTEDLYNSTATGLTPIDTDSDGTPDFLDLDSDDDGEPDIIEGHDWNNDGVVTDPEDSDFNPAGAGIPTGLDIDDDGLDDGFDNKTDGILGQSNSTNFIQPSSYADNDNVGSPGDESDWRDDDANIAGFIFADADEDGVREDGEGGVDGAVVRVFDASDDSELAARTVDSTGRFLFTDIKEPDSFGNAVANFYLVFEPIPTQSEQVPANVGGDVGDADRFDSDYTDQGGILRTIGSFTVGESAPAAFFGAGFGETSLPVEFITVTADVTSTCAATVSWTVADEVDVDRYVVERLAGEAWVVDAEVVATGATAYTASVSAADAYYRVANVDLDGSRGLSDIVAAEACAATSGRAAARPNPAATGMQVAFTWATAPTAPVTIHDAGGRVVGTLAPATDAVLETADLPTGIYVARNGAEAVRFVIR